jgi:hypothetical protein
LLRAEDLVVLSAAVAEVAADEAARNSEFAARLQATHRELTALRASEPRRRAEPQSRVKLVPLPGVRGIEIDPFAPFDPYPMNQIYGPTQLRAAMSHYPLATLKQGVAAVQQRHPGTKPRDARKIASLVDFIIEHVAGEEPSSR